MADTSTPSRAWPAPRSHGSGLRFGNGANLVQHLQLIPVLPKLSKLAVLHAEDVDSGDLDRSARRQHTEQIALVCARRGPANHDAVTAYGELADCVTSLRSERSPLMNEGTVRARSRALAMARPIMDVADVATAVLADTW